MPDLHETARVEKVVFLHMPKTGGGAMEWYLYEQFREVRRNYFLSFNGVDDSRFIRDELSTPREEGNKCVIEQIFSDRGLVRQFESSLHFQQAKVLFGHATCALGRLFPEYRFRYMTVLREPVERTISNIIQFSIVNDDVVQFGIHKAECERLSDAYWAFIYDILVREYPIDGLLIHENLYLRNCMTRILQGSTYLDVHEEPDLKLALANAMRMEISFFDEFNADLQRSFDALDIPIDMSQNLRGRHGRPEAGEDKKRYGRYCNAPQKVIDFVAEHNQTDLRLYDLLRAKLKPEA